MCCICTITFKLGLDQICHNNAFRFRPAASRSPLMMVLPTSTTLNARLFSRLVPYSSSIASTSSPKARRCLLGSQTCSTLSSAVLAKFHLAAGLQLRSDGLEVCPP